MGRFCGFLLRIVTFALIGLPLIAGSAMAGDRPAVLGVRAAHHDGITRVVLDLSNSVAFHLSADQNTIAVDLPELDWATESKGLSRPIGLLRNYRYQAAGAGSGRLVLDVDHSVLVEKAFLIPPAANGNYRLVLDLIPGPITAPAAQANQPKLTPAAVAVPSGGNPILSPPAGGAAAPPAARRLDGDVIASGPIPAALPIPAPPSALPTSPALPDKPLDRKLSHPGKPIVVIDPGHGGVDPGATSLTGVYEKNIVLALARDVKAQLDKGGKVKCVLTRDRDIFIPLRERVAIGRMAHADLFMSLHADTVADPDIRGLSVYTLSQTASDNEAQALADKENKADIVAGIDLSNETPEVTNILIDLVQRESMNLSAVFANHLIQEVARNTHQLLQNTHRFAGFAVLKAPDVPSVLVETGYLSNDQDERMLRRPEYRAKLATAMARAIEHYFAQTQKARRS